MKATNMISFSRQSALSIHNEAVASAKNLKSEYQKLFEILLVVEKRQIYFEFDIPDFRTYCKEMLELSSNVAREFGIVVRKSLEVPQLADAIRSGKISIYKARRISSVIDDSNHQEWIDLAIHCSSREVEKTVALANPRDAAPESLKYVAGDVLDFRMGVSEEWTKLLARTKDLLSQQFRRAISAEEATFYLMSEYCRKNDPLEKAKRAEKRKNEAKQTTKDGFETVALDFRTNETSESQSNLNHESQSTLSPHLKTGQTNSDQAQLQTDLKTVKAASDHANAYVESAGKFRTRYRPAEIEHQVDLRDGCQCTHIDKKGKRCQSRRWLQKHHIIEFADGGEHTVENLITLCSAHHKIQHLKSMDQTLKPAWHVPPKV